LKKLFVKSESSEVMEQRQKRGRRKEKASQASNTKGKIKCYEEKVRNKLFLGTIKIIVF